MPYNWESKKNLCPAWKPGESGNPAGRATASYGGKRLFMQALRAAIIEDAKMPKASEPVTPVRKPTPIEHRGPRQCRVCAHDLRPVIDGLITLGIPLRALAGSYGFSKSSLFRHKKSHLAYFPNAKKARQVTTIQEGLWQILRSRDGMEMSGCHDGASRALGRLWNLNHATAIEDPFDRLRIATIEVFARLIPILWRDDSWSMKAREQNMKDYTAAIETLSSWGRDNGALETR